MIVPMRINKVPIMRQIAGDPEQTRLFAAGLADPDQLDPNEFLRFGYLHSIFVVAIESTWREFRAGTTDRSEVTRVFEMCRRNLQSPGGVAWWEANSELLSLEFREFYESELGTQGAPTNVAGPAAQQSAAADSA